MLLLRIVCLLIVCVLRVVGKKAKKAQVIVDESKLPELTEVLSEVGFNETQITSVQKQGIDRTRQILKWQKIDILLLSEIGISAETGELLYEKINQLKALAISKAVDDNEIHPLAQLRKERAQVNYGRIYVNRSTASFEYKKAWFGAKEAPESWIHLVRAWPFDACRNFDKAFQSIYSNALIIADRGGCSFVEKAWNAHRVGAAILAVINDPEKSFDRPASGYATDEKETPTPDSLFVILLEAHAGPALHYAASAALINASKISKPAQRAKLRGYTSADATQARIVPLKCQPGQPTCRPLLPDEQELIPESDSGYLHVENSSFEYVAGAWGAIPPVRPLRLVRAVPPDLCSSPPNWACKNLGIFCPIPQVSKFASTAIASAILADRGGCNFSVKTAFADSVAAAALIIIDPSSQPLQRMGLRAPRLPPSLTGLMIDHDTATVLLEYLNSSTSLPRIRIASDYPGFATMWLKLLDLLPWPTDVDAAHLLYRRAILEHADSIQRQRWLNSSFFSHMANITSSIAGQNDGECSELSETSPPLPSSFSTDS
mmetsp:Transcript_3739/g.5235  ORF Transcript_3739/g.5235 Transcript_3739/m.5235 type:complete len:547 (-) Transcript_3739:451-2091(-)